MKLNELGYKSKIIANSSFYLGANHSVVECEIEGKNYIFDPTNGVYYKNSMEELLLEPGLVDKCIYQVAEEDTLQSYICKDFFENIYSSSYYSNMIRLDNNGGYIIAGGGLDNISGGGYER